jgi:hypothetical protein
VSGRWEVGGRRTTSAWGRYVHENLGGNGTSMCNESRSRWMMFSYRFLTTVSLWFA